MCNLQNFLFKTSNTTFCLNLENRFMTSQKASKEAVQLKHFPPFYSLNVHLRFLDTIRFFFLKNFPKTLWKLRKKFAKFLKTPKIVISHLYHIVFEKRIANVDKRNLKQCDHDTNGALTQVHKQKISGEEWEIR